VYVVDYVRRLEEAMIRTFAELDLRTGRVPGRSGVWVAGDDRLPDRKLAAIGVRVAARTTMHGFAINVDPDLSWFDRIVPCGIADAGLTSLSRELGTEITISEVAHVLKPHLEELLTFEPYQRSPDLRELAVPAA
jgi:lipoyl(octanoyl) transferase